MYLQVAITPLLPREASPSFSSTQRAVRRWVLLFFVLGAFLHFTSIATAALPSPTRLHANDRIEALATQVTALDVSSVKNLTVLVAGETTVACTDITVVVSPYFYDGSGAALTSMPRALTQTEAFANSECTTVFVFDLRGIQKVEIRVKNNRTATAITDYVDVYGDPAVQPVSGPVTDAQLRASAVPVSGPLTDTQLRASTVPVSGTVTANQGTDGSQDWGVNATSSGTTVATLSNEDHHRLDLSWWGTWAIVGLLLAQLIGFRFMRAIDNTRGLG